MKVYKTVSHIAIDHISNIEDEFKTSIAKKQFRKIKIMDIKMKFNIQSVPIRVQ